MAPGEGSDEGCDCCAAGVKVAVELVNIVGSGTGLGEDGVYDEAAGPTLHDHFFFGLDSCFEVGT